MSKKEHFQHWWVNLKHSWYMVGTCAAKVKF